jgi:hypothetical protein
MEMEFISTAGLSIEEAKVARPTSVTFLAGEKSPKFSPKRFIPPPREKPAPHPLPSPIHPHFWSCTASNSFSKVGANFSQNLWLPTILSFVKTFVRAVEEDRKDFFRIYSIDWRTNSQSIRMLAANCCLRFFGGKNHKSIDTGCSLGIQQQIKSFKILLFSF